VEGLEELGEVHGGRGDLVQRLLLDGHGAVTPPRRHGPRRPALRYIRQFRSRLCVLAKRAVSA
jgi:hypothetical protein